MASIPLMEILDSETSFIVAGVGLAMIRIRSVEVVELELWVVPCGYPVTGVGLVMKVYSVP